MSLKEENIAKNKEFDAIMKPKAIISVLLTVATIVTIFVSDIKLDIFSIKLIIVALIIIAMMFINICIITLNWGNECPKCAARGYEKELSRNLINETSLGNKTTYDPRSEQSRGKIHFGSGSVVRNADGSESIKHTYAVFNRSYAFRKCCIFCDYEWSGTETRKEQEEL